LINSINSLSKCPKTFDLNLEKTEKTMKATNYKTLFAVVSAILLSATALISSQSPALALDDNKKLGQDVAGKNCERIDTPVSSTFGKCENVCKDKEVTRDAENNRWVCKASKASGARPRVERAPVVGKAQDSGANPNPKHQPPTGSKTGKAKKN
jgi:hypothetical protein